MKAELVALCFLGLATKPTFPLLNQTSQCQMLCRHFPQESERLIRVSFTIKNTVVKTAFVHTGVMIILIQTQ